MFLVKSDPDYDPIKDDDIFSEYSEIAKIEKTQEI